MKVTAEANLRSCSSFLMRGFNYTNWSMTDGGLLLKKKECLLSIRIRIQKLKTLKKNCVEIPHLHYMFNK